MPIINKTYSFTSDDVLLDYRHSYVASTQPWDLTPVFMVCIRIELATRLMSPVHTHDKTTFLRLCAL